MASAVEEDCAVSLFEIPVFLFASFGSSEEKLGRETGSNGSERVVGRRGESGQG